MSTRTLIGQIVVDCTEPERLSAFWGRVLEVPFSVRSRDWATVHSTPPVCFQRVPEGKVVKNRIHLDLAVTDIDAAHAGALTAGARFVTSFVDAQGACVVLQDPEGNEFCLTAPPAVREPPREPHER